MFRSLLVTLLALLLPLGAFAQDPVDPGIPDTFCIVPMNLTIGQSTPVNVLLFNDEIIDACLAVISITGLDGGFARFDSITFDGRLSDPSVMNDRTITTSMIDGVNADTLLILFRQSGSGHDLSPGTGTFYRMWFTGLTAGSIVLDSAHWLQNMNISLVAEQEGFPMFSPYFRPETLNVVQSALPPVITLPAAPAPIVVGQQIQFEVSAASPQGGSVTLLFDSLAKYDDESIQSTDPPTRTGDNPATFTWTPGPGDVGIWKASFEAYDDSIRWASASLVIQVVSSSEYVVTFDRTETENCTQATGLAHGDLDNDNLPELFASGVGLPYSYATYGLDESGNVGEIAHVYDGFAKGTPNVGYFDSDSILDVALTSWQSAVLLHGLGDNTFQPDSTIDLAIATDAISAQGDWNNDARLDLAIVRPTGFYLLLSDSTSHLVYFDTLTSRDTTLSINAADFNGDGWDDIAVGTVSGLEIYLNTHDSSFTLAYTYNQTFGARDVKVTNQGADINNDGLFDLCLSTPSVGGFTSNLMVYLGQAGGSFIQQTVRSIYGQIFANCVGDFNGDTYLDIAFVNGARKYLAVLFGDGTGAFPNEVRYDVPAYTPFQLDCLDFDLDGDMDILVSAYNIYDTGSFFFYRNQLNPPHLAGTLKVKAQNNAKLAIIAPNGASLDEVKQVMPTSSYYRRSLDADSHIDAVAAVGTLQPGGYRLHVSPKANLTTAAPFSLSYEAGGKPFCIAQNLPMTPDGYDFMVYPDGSSPIHPLLGEYITSPQPVFSWPASGTVLFELATDPGFANVIDSATLSGAGYTSSASLNDDSTIYFWRVTPEAGLVASTSFNSFVVVKAPTAVDETEGSGLPRKFALKQNYPNPFNPTTTISYDLPRACHVTLEVYNLLGQRVVMLVDRAESAGARQVTWNGADQSGHPVTSGVYFYRLTAGDFRAGAKMLLLK